MMSAKRASIFDTEETLDVSGFAPRTADKPMARAEQVRAVSEAAQFQSRGPKPRNETAARREPRRYRTGRNIQLNIKARAETIETFYAIADQQGWVLGEAFEQAIEALKRELDPQTMTKS